VRPDIKQHQFFSKDVLRKLEWQGENPFHESQHGRCNLEIKRRLVLGPKIDCVSLEILIEQAVRVGYQEHQLVKHPSYNMLPVFLLRFERGNVCARFYWRIFLHWHLLLDHSRNVVV